MMNISLYQFYTDKVAALTAEIVKLKRHNTTFVLAELLLSCQCLQVS